MSGFQVGDVVVLGNFRRCEHWSSTPNRAVKPGVIYRVATVHPGPFNNGCKCGLKLAGVQHEAPFGICAGWMRKVDRADDQFTASIRACKPQAAKVSA